MKQDNTTTLQNDKGFTPGEWKIIPISDCCLTIQIDGFREDKKGGYIAEINWQRAAGGIGKEDEANAALIASAPQLKAENEKLRNDVRVLREALNEYVEIEKENHGMMPVILRPATKKIIQALNQTKQD